MTAINNTDLIKVQIRVSASGAARVEILPLLGRKVEPIREEITKNQKQQIDAVQGKVLQNFMLKIMGITMRVFQLRNTPAALKQLLSQAGTCTEQMNEDEQACFDAIFPICLGQVNAAYSKPLFSQLVPLETRKSITRAQLTPEIKPMVEKISKISRQYLQDVKNVMKARKEELALMSELSMGLVSFSREDLLELKKVLAIKPLDKASIEVSKFSSQENGMLSEALLEAVQNGFKKQEKFGQDLLEYLNNNINNWMTKRSKHTDGKSSEAEEKQPDLKRQKI
jgi:hypothetical protein